MNIQSIENDFFEIRWGMEAIKKDTSSDSPFIKKINHAAFEMLDFIDQARAAWKDGKSVFSYLNSANIPYICILDPNLMKLANKCSRNALHILDPSQVDTPYSGKSLIDACDKIEMPFLLPALPIDAVKILNLSIKKYLNNWSNQSELFVQYAEEQFFFPWKNSQNCFDPSPIFTAMMWGIVEHFMLGVEIAKHTPYANCVLNLLGYRFKSTPVFLSKYIYAGVSEKGTNDFKEYIISLIRQAENKQVEEPQEDNSLLLFDYWIRNNLFGQIQETFTPELNEKLMNKSQEYQLTPQQIILRDAFCTFIIAMQENITSVMITCLVNKKRQESLPSYSQEQSKPLCPLNFVREALNFMPPASLKRELSAYTEIVRKDTGEIVCAANPGDILVISPAIYSHLHGDYKEGTDFNQHAEKICPEKFVFSEGIHKCPGQNFAIKFLSNLYAHLISNHELAIYSNNDSLGRPLYTGNFNIKADIRVKLGKESPRDKDLVNFNQGCRIS